jgi:hypothetical protein
MHSGSILAKTEKGQEELATRTHGLSPRLRSALIMADGQTEVAAILERCGEFAAKVELQFEELIANGFLEDVAEGHAAFAPVEELVEATFFPDLRDMTANRAADQSLPIEATREMLNLFVEKLDENAVAFSEGIIACETPREIVLYLDKIMMPLRKKLSDAETAELMRRAKEILNRYR